jgi:hypothetical protein
MSTSVKPYPPSVPARLVVHCSEFQARHPSAYLRLVAELGDSLTEMLLFALLAPQGRCGSSSP